MTNKKRPRVRVKFKYNTDTGEIEEFIIDDNAPGASENYHNGIARAFTARLSKNAEIEDAGNIRLSDTVSELTVSEQETEAESGKLKPKTEILE